MIARELNEPKLRPAITLAATIEGPFTRPRISFWKFLKNLFSSQDMDLNQFERLEAKRTRHQIDRERQF